LNRPGGGDRVGFQLQRRGRGVPQHDRDWVNAKCPKEHALELERQEDHDGSNFPEQLWQDMADAGFFGIGIDEELGGQGGNCTIQSIFMEEIARSLAGIAWIWGVNQFNTKSIQRFASDDLKQELIPQLVEGKVKTAIAVTEPGAGTDLLGGMITTAEPTATASGSTGKIWSTWRTSPTICSFSQRPTRTPKASRGKTLFLVDAKQDGVVARTIEARHALRRLVRVQLDNAFVPSARDRRRQRGWGHILSTLATGASSWRDVHRHPPRDRKAVATRRSAGLRQEDR
jgi:acyl-CoA dehydrogenase